MSTIYVIAALLGSVDIQYGLSHGNYANSVSSRLGLQPKLTQNHKNENFQFSLLWVTTIISIYIRTFYKRLQGINYI